MRLFFLFLCLLHATNTFAQNRVVDVLSREEFLIEVDPFFVSNDELIALVQTPIDNEVIAQGDCKKIGELFLCKINSSLNYGIVTRNAPVRIFDSTRSYESYSGNANRIIRDQPKIFYKYKPLLNQGLISGETASTLSKKEYLVDMFGSTHYGVTNDFNVGLLTTSLLSDLIVTKFKYRFYKSDYMIMSASLEPKYSLEEETWNHRLSLYFDTISNAKVINHLTLTLNLNRTAKIGTQDQEVDKTQIDNKIQTGVEYIMDDWNRIVYGPSFNFDTDSIGGFVSYIILYQSWHFVLSLESQDLSNFTVSSTEGYLPSFYIYYRF